MTGAIWGVAADTSRDDDVDRLVAEVLVHLGRIDTLVNSAGIGSAGASALEPTSADWRRVLEVNLTGPFLVARAVARHMAAADGGSIVNVASLNGLAAEPHFADYNAARTIVKKLAELERLRRQAGE